MEMPYEMERTPLLFQTMPEVVGFSVGRFAAHAVLDELPVGSIESGIVQCTQLPP
ncbi:hypothetical protein [Burkholderia glumae]|uniref:hypothetical protein n=1 Tax=Burkholderia glumae TaxID=337 RepID=UPI003BA11106